MPIIQISEIRHRRGLKEDLPELSEGELGLAVDTGELFIGTPGLPSITRDLIAVLWQSSHSYSIGDFVSNTGLLYRCNTDHTSGLTFNTAFWDEVTNSDFANPNTRILTEWAKNVENILKYSYINRDNRLNSERQSAFGFQEILDYYEDLPDVWPYQAIRRVGQSTYDEVGVRRYLQERLDERVSVLAYGATGNGREYLTDSSERFSNDMDAEANAIRRATVDLANKTEDDVSDNNLHDKNRAVYFPAGTYVVNKQLFLMPRTTWLGDGIGKTRIVFNLNDMVLNENNNSLLMTIGKSTVDGPGNFISVQDVVDDTKIDEYSYQNISELIKDIYVNGISFEIFGEPAAGSTVSAADAIRLIRASNVTFENCNFVGTWDVSNVHAGPFDFTQDSMAIGVDSAGDSLLAGPNSMYCRDLRFLNCTFLGFYYGALLSDSMVGVHFDKCVFERMYRAVTIGEGTSSSSSWATFPLLTAELNAPRNVKLFNNIFKHISSNGALVCRGYAGDGIAKSATYAEYENNERLVGNLPFEQSTGVLFVGNRWENVGNYDLISLVSDDSYVEDPKVPVVHFYAGTTYNMCVGDTFGRDITISGGNYGTAARVWYDPADPNIVLNPQDNAFFKAPLEAPPTSVVLEPTVGFASASTPIVLGDVNGANSFYSIELTYSIVYENYGPLRRRKTGKVRVLVDPGDPVGTGPTLSFDVDETLVNGPDDIAFNVVVTGGNEIEVLVDFNNSLVDPTTATMYYEIETHYAPAP